MSFDRNKFKAASLEANKAVSAEVSKTLKIGSSNRGDYHSIDIGANLFRIFPPHNIEDPSFQPKVVYWIECKVQKNDSDGNVLEGQYEWKKRPIFDSRIHGGTSKDIIDEYIKFTRNTIFESFTDKKEASKQLAPIYGWKDSSGKWNQGILPSSSFVAYATKGDITIANLGRLELYQSDKDELEKLNIDQDTGEVIATDIFSGPDDGIQFVLTRQKENDKWKNKITKKEFKPKTKDVAKDWNDFLLSQVIPDDVLEHWSKMEPLVTQFKGTYKRSDFERALEALQEFERKHGYHTFENDEFLDIVEEINGYYPEDGEEAEQDTPEVVETTEDNKGKLEGLNREELKKYIKDNKLGIKVLPSMTEFVIIDMIKDLEAKQDTPEEYSSCPPVVTEDPVVIDKLPFEDEEEKKTEESKVDFAASLRKRLQQQKDTIKE